MWSANEPFVVGLLGSHGDSGSMTDCLTATRIRDPRFLSRFRVCVPFTPSWSLRWCWCWYCPAAAGATGPADAVCQWRCCCCALPCSFVITTTTITTTTAITATRYAGTLHRTQSGERVRAVFPLQRVWRLFKARRAAEVQRRVAEDHWSDNCLKETNEDAAFHEGKIQVLLTRVANTERALRVRAAAQQLLLPRLWLRRLCWCWCWSRGAGTVLVLVLVLVLALGLVLCSCWCW